MTWSNTQCLAVNPAGERCTLPAGHLGDHEIGAVHGGTPAAPWPPVTVASSARPPMSWPVLARAVGIGFAIFIGGSIVLGMIGMGRYGNLGGLIAFVAGTWAGAHYGGLRYGKGYAAVAGLLFLAILLLDAIILGVFAARN